MKKIILAMLCITMLATQSFAATIYTTTIQETNVEQVQEVLIEIMTGKNFAIDEVTPYKVTFNKNFGDGFWVASQATTVIFNLLARDGNVKMMVTQTELINSGFGGMIKRQRSIEHLVPIIKEVRHVIDGTPLDQIANEAVNQLPGSGNEREKRLGLKIANKDVHGKFRIEKVSAGSYAAEAKVAVGDILVEMNGRNASAYEKDALESYIANKWGEGSSLVFVFERDGEIKLVTLKRPESIAQSEQTPTGSTRRRAQPE